MIIEQYGKKQRSIALNEWHIKVGFISGVFLLLILLSATNSSSDHTLAAFAQEQNNNTCSECLAVRSFYLERMQLCTNN